MWALISSSRSAWEQPVVKWRAVVHALRSVCSKNGSALECSWATPFPATVKKVIYLVFGGLSARAWDFIGCNLILNCSATYTFHSRGGDTRRGSSIKGWQACQSSVPAVFKHQLYKCAVSVRRSREYKYGIPCMQCTQGKMKTGETKGRIWTDGSLPFTGSCILEWPKGEFLTQRIEIFKLISSTPTRF